MGAKKIIIELLITDMKHEQLIHGLRQLGFTSELHDTNISGIVAQLMGTQEEAITWEWMDVYVDFLKQACKFPTTGNGDNLLPLAEECYNKLKACLPAKAGSNSHALTQCFFYVLFSSMSNCF